MPLVPNFTVSQSSADLTTLIVTDTSTGSDVLVTSRIVFVEKVNGAYLVPAGVTTNYTTWSIADIAKNLAIMDDDYAVFVTVKWLGASLQELYTKTILFDVDGYGQQFLFTTTQQQITNPAIVQDTDYYSNKIRLYVNLADAKNAVVIGSNAQVAQISLNKAKFLRDNAAQFF